jgi:hypothetical protein
MDEGSFTTGMVGDYPLFNGTGIQTNPTTGAAVMQPYFHSISVSTFSAIYLSTHMLSYAIGYIRSSSSRGFSSS